MEFLRDNQAMQRREAWTKDGWIACIDAARLRALDPKNRHEAYLVSRWKPEMQFGTLLPPPKFV